MNLEEMKKKQEELEARVEKAEKFKKDYEAKAAADIAGGGAPEFQQPVYGSRSNSDEQRAMTYFGCKSARDLLDVNTCDPRYQHVPMELKQLVMSFKEDMDISRMIAQRFHGAPMDREDQLGKVKGILDTHYGKTVLAPKIKTFDSTTPGAGDEWVPTGLSSQFIEEYELDRAVANKFRTINMPTQPYELPVQKDVTRARIQDENATKTDVNFGTDKITFNATKLCEFMILPEELNEDSAPQILALIRQDVVAAQTRAIEAAILNGDTTATHMDNDTDGGAADLAEKAWKGLRKLALENSANGVVTNFGGAVTSITNLRAMRASMGIFGKNERELCWIVSTKVYNQMLDLEEVTTVEKYGPMATILRGALAALDGIPIVVSEFARDDLAATGVNTAGGPNDFSAIHLVNTKRFYNGMRRPIRVRAVVDPTPPNDRWLIASWTRSDFQGHEQGTREKSIALGRNVA